MGQLQRQDVLTSERRIKPNDGFGRQWRLRSSRIGLVLPRLVFFVAVWGLALTVPSDGRAEAQRDVNVGVFVTDLFDLDFSERDVQATFWVWLTHAVSSFDAQKGIEIVNARSINQLQYYRTDAGQGRIWETVKYSAFLNEKWSLANYPFDRQRIRLVIESADLDARAIRFVPDLDQTAYMSDLELPGWTIEKIAATTSEAYYRTTFGDPTLTKTTGSSFPRAIFEIVIKRDGWRLFFSTFIGFVLAIALSGIVLTNNAVKTLNDVIEMGGQVGLGTGAVFSVIGSGYILQNGLPPTTEFSLADAFQITAFAVTFLTMLSVFVVHALRKHGHEATALKVSRVLFGSYILTCLLMIYRVVLAAYAV